jgi:predicted ArsR family transcriptional regulator
MPFHQNRVVENEVDSPQIMRPLKMGSNDENPEISQDFSRNIFFEKLILGLSNTLQEVIGLKESSGFIAVVGAQLGDYINRVYRSAYGKAVLNRKEVSDTLIDLKKRIGGGFFIIEESEDTIVLGNDKCPFGKDVNGQPALCMMTSSVFGRIAAENTGYAKVAIEKAIAKGDGHCHVIVHLSRRDAENTEGIEYFGRGSNA